jgi:tRNA A37 methylthiotransferase MiaB
MLDLVDQIKAASPQTLLVTHFIVGYPGEHAADFLKSLAAAKHFDYPIAFKYSRDEHTVSASLPHQKSDMMISLRYLTVFVFMNLVVLYRLLTAPPLVTKT